MILLALLIVTLWVLWRVYHFSAYTTHRLEGKTVLVTGANSELGRELCLSLYAHKAKVIAWDSNKIKLEELRREARRRNGEKEGEEEKTTTTTRTTTTAAAAAASTNYNDSFVIVSVDLSSRLQISRALGELSQGGGNGGVMVDCVVNAAHLYPIKPYMDREEESSNKLFQVNTAAPLILARHFIPLMLRRKNGGQFVTVVHGAMANLIGGVHPTAPDYAATQWAAVGQHHSIAEWVREEHRRRRTEGTVHCTLLYTKEVEKGTPASVGLTTSASASSLRRSGGSPQKTNPTTPDHSSPTPSSEAVARRAVGAIRRREEVSGRSPLDAFLPALYGLPAPWVASLARWLGFTAGGSVGGEREGGGEKKGQ